MNTQQTKPGISQESESSLAGAAAGKRLGIRFLPDIAFAVRCHPAEPKPSAMGMCCPDANAGRTLQVPGKADALGQ
jgi:hypothetical protein